jgi:uncharacterized damage-inducible protein DinB
MSVTNNSVVSFKAAIATLITRELGAMKRELDAYPDDAAVWKSVPGLPNTAGTLALHVAGNLQHFFGSILGRDGYVRARDLEFSRRDVTRVELKAGFDAAIASVERTMHQLPDAGVQAAYPEPIAKRTVSTDVFLLHLVAHLAYHLGQMDYHRRAVTGDAKGVDAVSVRELPERT